MAIETVSPAGTTSEWALTPDERRELASRLAKAAGALRDVLAPLRSKASRRYASELVHILADEGMRPDDLACTVECLESTLRRERRGLRAATVLRLVRPTPERG